MMSKSSLKKTQKNLKQGKIGFYRLILIIFAVVIALMFIVFSIFKPIRKNTENRTSTNILNKATTFRKDGRLSFHLSGNLSPVNIDIEIADDEAERMRGLMDRISMPEFAGMLFIFENDEPRSFWMKNTYISLDIIFINSNKEIVSIQKYTQPQTTSSIPSDKPATFVLEVNAGFTDKYGINPGDKIDFIK
jgi:uncharacterized membrane protein (UPF0127 family)